MLVVAVEQAVAAPICTLRLADAGARVIKIERPGGETARHYDRTVQGTSAYFAWLNRGKESVVLDFRHNQDFALLRRLVAASDIFVQNLAPGALERLGIGSGRLLKENPRLIAVDIVGYGSETDYGHMRAYDMLVQAEAGLCSVTGTLDTPCKVGVSVADIATGMNAHAAILEALFERQTSGRGKRIEIAMFDCLADWMSVPLAHHEYGNQPTPRTALSHASIYPYSSYRCADGEIVLVVQNSAEWQRLCRGVLEKPELIGDPRFQDNPSRVANRLQLEEIIQTKFAGMTVADAVVLLTNAKLAWSRISDVDALADHPALRRMDVPVPGGTYRGVASPIRGSFAAGPVPALGEHSAAVRAEFA